jgi:glycerol dehydrogenase
VGLPTRLADIHVDATDRAALLRVAERACREGEIMHNEPYPVNAGMVVAALEAMDHYAALMDHAEPATL